jgi:phosphoglycerol transferase MdoB-like AlkP superfamily enzyme
MSLFRLVFFLYYNPITSLEGFYIDILNAFWLGFRIDLTVIAYIQIIPTILLIAFYYTNRLSVLNFLNKFLVSYLFLCFCAVAILLCADFGFYSYFKDHINVIFFGLFDDDTKALLDTFLQNYNVFLILAVFISFLATIFILIKKIFNIQEQPMESFFKLKNSVLIFSIILILNFLAARGTLGMYPLGKMIPNVSTEDFINKTSQNGVRAFMSAYGHRQDYLKRKYDLIEETGFKGKIEKAFEIHKHGSLSDKENLLNNLKYTTTKNDDEEYNVIVIMVESFGMPILKYQSEEFNILSNLKKHFDKDTLFTNFISDGDGTISSLQALLLGIPHRPNSFEFSQSIYKQTSFDYTAAFLYNNAGYETSFIYGGDLTWRNLGNFIKYQGYQNIEGKMNIFDNLANKSGDDYFHPWGIFDEYLYAHIMKKLENSDKKQFIVALSTNNHPPYNVPKNYKAQSLVFNETVKKHITGDFELAQQRFASYQYAVDQVGIFLDNFKQSKFKDNTIVVITADNNTIDGIMKYDDNELFNSKNIPLYFYLPQKLKQKLNIDTTVAGSQKDIFPTLYNITLKDTSYLAVGNNLFDKMSNHYGFNGSMIINEKDQAKKLNSLKEKTEDDMLNYYKATLAVTEYIIDYNYKKNKNDK